MRFFGLERVMNDNALQQDIVQCIRKGYVFFYPTDTVYGFGCDATKREATNRIKSIKETNHPFSVIAPSNEWILENLIVHDKSVLDKLPGPYTLIFKKKSLGFMDNVCNNNSLAVRIPDHPLTQVIQKSERPFVTTSANITGEPVITNPSSIPRDIARELDIIIDAGQLGNHASTIIDCTDAEARVNERK